MDGATARGRTANPVSLCIAGRRSLLFGCHRTDERDSVAWTRSWLRAAAVCSCDASATRPGRYPLGRVMSAKWWRN
jgi:hypothetical protein